MKYYVYIFLYAEIKGILIMCSMENWPGYKSLTEEILEVKGEEQGYVWGGESRTIILMQTHREKKEHKVIVLEKSFKIIKSNH